MLASVEQSQAPTSEYSHTTPPTINDRERGAEMDESGDGAAPERCRRLFHAWVIGAALPPPRRLRYN
ncbi:MAG TPA: hypothetical protein VI814_10745 [Candidatus Limnocylindria bacterium]